MLKNILKILNRDGYISKTRLAKELNVANEIIDEGINQLLRMGYLVEEETGESCSTFCGSCSFTNSCSKGTIKTFRILERANKYID